jgi:hypothetical protein
MGKIYISGPMSGYPEFNFPAFFAMEEFLVRQGWTVFNPANKEQEKELDAEAFETGDNIKAIAAGFDFRECFTWDTQKVIEADAICMLKGWEASPGARAEHAVAVAMQKHYLEYQILYSD